MDSSLEEMIDTLTKAAIESCIFRAGSKHDKIVEYSTIRLELKRSLSAIQSLPTDMDAIAALELLYHDKTGYEEKRAAYDYLRANLQRKQNDKSE